MKPLKDYSFIRGICHNPHYDYPQETLERDLRYAQRLNLNSVRFWMSEEEWAKDPVAYKAMIGNFMETCWKYGINSMPIFWNGNFIANFVEPTEEEYARSAEYAKDIIDTFKDKEYILMWDVINEPMCNDYLRHSKGAEYDERFANLTRYVRRLCKIVRDLDSETCLTVGHEQVKHCVSSVDLVDVICYHDYLTTRKDIEGAILEAKAMSEANGNKPILNTETGCVGRANPYALEIELATKHNVGWYLFLLVMDADNFWGDIHGLVYSDGTIRDPEVIAAMFGFFRNRTEGRIRVNANKEGHAYRAVKAVEDVLRVEETTLFMSKVKTTDDILLAAEYCVNILEAAEMVPMWNPPSARIECWRRMPEEQRDVYEIKRFAYDMAELVRKNCMF